MSAHIVQITELPIVDGKISAAVEAWSQLAAPKGSVAWTLYRRIDNGTLIELVAFDDWPHLADLEAHGKAQWDAVREFAAGDFRRELLDLVEEPKPTRGALPGTSYLQLRYVEVRPPVYEAYRAWREETIFDVVRTSPEVGTFSAYHTAMSTKPGVMFLSGFDGDVDEYRQVFSSDRYTAIVQAAGDNYITGGNAGLATHIYELVDA